MKTTLSRETTLKKDLENKKITVSREFGAPRSKVWDAWTKSEILDLWWAPKPWKAVTKSQDFKEGGRWHYYMAGPSGEKEWCLLDYIKIDQKNSYTAKDSFCDENQNKRADFPSMTWKSTFTDAGNDTNVNIEITFESEEALNKILEMGFQEGFTMAHGNLDELIAENKI